MLQIHHPHSKPPPPKPSRTSTCADMLRIFEIVVRDIYAASAPTTLAYEFWNKGKLLVQAKHACSAALAFREAMARQDCFCRSDYIETGTVFLNGLREILARKSEREGVWVYMCSVPQNATIPEVEKAVKPYGGQVNYLGDAPRDWVFLCNDFASFEACVDAKVFRIAGKNVRRGYCGELQPVVLFFRQVQRRTGSNLVPFALTEEYEASLRLLVKMFDDIKGKAEEFANPAAEDVDELHRLALKDGGFTTQILNAILQGVVRFVRCSKKGWCLTLRPELCWLDENVLTLITPSSSAPLKEATTPTTALKLKAAVDEKVLQLDALLQASGRTAAQEHKKVVALATKCITADPTSIASSAYYARRSIAYSFLKEPNKALVDAKMSLRLTPRSANSHYAKGLALEGLKQLSEALKAFADATALDETHDAAAACAASLNRRLMAATASPAARDPSGPSSDASNGRDDELQHVTCDESSNTSPGVIESEVARPAFALDTSGSCVDEVSSSTKAKDTKGSDAAALRDKIRIAQERLNATIDAATREMRPPPEGFMDRLNACRNALVAAAAAVEAPFEQS